jgi:hypothetical protein
MATISEDYVSFETAKLLKEKGMDKSCFKHYVQKNNNDGTSEIVTVCTLQIAMKWLREVHNIHISVYVFNRELPITNVPIFYTCDIATEKLSSQQGHLRGAWKSYEEACEAAIKYCLENLV